MKLRVTANQCLLFDSTTSYIHTYIYIVGEKTTNKLQVHPYKPVSWLLTRHWIALATTKQPCRDELVVYSLFFSPTIYTLLYSYVSSTVLRKSNFTLYIYIKICVCVCVCMFFVDNIFLKPFIRIQLRKYTLWFNSLFNVLQSFRYIRFYNFYNSANLFSLRPLFNPSCTGLGQRNCYEISWKAN